MGDTDQRETNESLKKINKESKSTGCLTKWILVVSVLTLIAVVLFHFLPKK